MALSRNFVAFVLLAIAVLSRFLPHLPNFTPVLAVSLFGGVFFSNRGLALGLPLGIMFLSDLFIGLHDLIPVVYGLLVLFAIVGMYLKDRLSVGSLVIAGVAGALTFFLVTNFFVWLTSGMYSMDANGLVACYIAALPFFQYSILGDAVYIPLLFGSHYLLEKAGVVPAPQTT